MEKSWTSEDIVIGLVQAFGANNPEIKLDVSVRHDTYVIKLSYDFTSLPHDVQKKGRQHINQLMEAIQSLGVKTHLELGEL